MPAENTDQLYTVVLRHMQLQPEKANVVSHTTVVVKVEHNNSYVLSDCIDSQSRKFIFILQETDEETPPLSQGQSYTFATPLVDVGVYSLQCINYSKIHCIIEILEQITVDKNEITKKNQNIQQKVPLQNDQLGNDSIELCGGTFDKTNSVSDIADYEKMLGQKDLNYDIMPNKYLKYFREQFKLWSDFFESQPPESRKNTYGSQTRQKMSSGSLSFSQRQSACQKQSVISHLRSQQQISQIQEVEEGGRTMKKTNSQYGFNVGRENQKTHFSSNVKPLYTKTSSPHPRTEQSEVQSFVDWACKWADDSNLNSVNIKRKNDSHLVKQWFTFLQNKFKIDSFMYG